MTRAFAKHQVLDFKKSKSLDLFFYLKFSMIEKVFRVQRMLQELSKKTGNCSRHCARSQRKYVLKLHQREVLTYKICLLAGVVSIFF